MLLSEVKAIKRYSPVTYGIDGTKQFEIIEQNHFEKTG
jgi:hypothetical protein